MRYLVILLAACLTHSSSSSPVSTPDVHRPNSAACTATSGDTNGPDECLTDADCGTTNVCSCAGNTFEYAHATRNICVPANCRVDTDCGAFMCSPTNSDGGPFYGVQGYFCHTAADECGRDSDCAKTMNGQQGYCMFDHTVSHWICGYTFAAG